MGGGGTWTWGIECTSNEKDGKNPEHSFIMRIFRRIVLASSI
jgi:hypothetical protein